MGKKVQKSRKWRAINLGINEHAPDLISIEELVNYTTVRSNDNDYVDCDEVEEDDNAVAKKKKKKKKQQQRETQKGNSQDRKNKRKFDDHSAKPTSPVKRKKLDSDGQPELAADEDLKCDMTAWEKFSLPDAIVNALSVQKFTNPTEIQALALPEAIVKKKDILGAAETGSGKTLAFLIPIVTAILNAQKAETETDDGILWAVILTPTRELSIQVKNHAMDLCRFTNIKVVEIVGGLSIEKQNRKLNEKPHIVVGTPGRLWELVRMGNEHLSQINKIKFFVIDEADRMLEKNHFTELTCLLERINPGAKANKRQTFVFSATLTMIHETPSYVFKKKRQMGKVKKGSTKMTLENKLHSFIEALGLSNPSVLDITKKNVLAAGIKETCIQCSIEEKDEYLHYLIKMHTGRKIVFCNSISCVRRIHRLLCVLQCNVKILFANIAQNQRLKNLENFQKDPNGLLLATDVAARGLDIPNVEYIVHYEVPKTSELYVHRSGRSVRGVSAEGTSVILVSPPETYHYNKIRHTLGKAEKMLPYTVSKAEVLLASKRLVGLGRKIEQLECKMRSSQANSNWIEKCAKEMDIIVDDDEMPDKFDDGVRKSYQVQIKRLRAELKYLLSKPVVPLQETLRYPSFSLVQSFLEKVSNDS